MKFVPENCSIVTFLPFNESGFIACERTSDDKWIGRGKVQDQASSKARAIELAVKENLPIIFPN